MDFIAALKSICYEAKANYHDVSSYLISAFCERIKRLTQIKGVLGAEEQEQYRVVASILLRLMFFLYTVAPTVNASYRLAVGVTLLLRFSRQHLPLESGVVEQLIFSEALKFLSAEGRHKSAALSTFVSLEAINVLLVVRELGEAYLLPKGVVERLFTCGGGVERCAEWCYFDIVTCMFYIENHPEYSELKNAIEIDIARRLGDMSDVHYHAEKAYLFLDMLTCPHVCKQNKKTWINKFRMQFALPVYTSKDLDAFLDASAQNPWFINWEGVDMLTLLQKKEVVQSY
jgi:hypothetical protein